MPRKAPADYEQILEVFEETQSKAETARRLGVHPNTVYQALRRREGICTRCGKEPALADKLVCETCRLWINAREDRKRQARRAGGKCFICSEPVDAPASAMYCRKHRLADAARRRANRPSRTAWTPADKHRVRMKNLRTLYGEGAVTAWERDSGVCQACGAVKVGKKQMHLHHIDIDRTNNALENLVVLCSDCHLLFHKILRHPKAGAVIAWATRTYPDFEKRFHDLVEPTSTPTGRSA